MRTTFMTGRKCGKTRKARVSDGAWVAWWPKGEGSPLWRHWVPDEATAWGPPTRTLCGARMGDNGCLYIGGMSETVTFSECPECVAMKAAVANA